MKIYFKSYFELQHAINKVHKAQGFRLRSDQYEGQQWFEQRLPDSVLGKTKQVQHVLT